MEFWVKRFRDRHVSFEGPTRRDDDEQVLSFSDPDGLVLEIVAHPKANERGGWDEGPIPSERAIRGFHAVTITEEGYESTAAMLTKDLGFRLVREEGNRFRYEVGLGGPEAIVDIVCKPAAPRGVVSIGTVHHVAWRTPNDEQQKTWRKTLVDSGLNVTTIIDRRYFHSIYFREPGGVLFEIATDPPGFTIDEPESELGKKLKLPPWLEPIRQHLEHVLPSVHLPRITGD